MKSIVLEKEIKTLGLSNSINKKLNDNNIILIKDLWVYNRQSLKKIGFTDREIQSITINWFRFKQKKILITSLSIFLLYIVLERLICYN